MYLLTLLLVGKYNSVFVYFDSELSYLFFNIVCFFGKMHVPTCLKLLIVKNLV